MRTGACRTESAPSSTAPPMSAALPPYCRCSPLRMIVATPSARGMISIASVPAQRPNISIGTRPPATASPWAPNSQRPRPKST